MSTGTPYAPAPPPKEKPVNANLVYPLVAAAIMAAVGGLVRGEVTASRVVDLRANQQTALAAAVKVAVLEAQLNGISNSLGELKTDVKSLAISVGTLTEEVRDDNDSK
jgi:hypothetical protein